MPNVKMPPNPQQAVLKKIYPWDEYNITLVTEWLYLQAQKTGFPGTFEDFKLRYGGYIAATDPQEIQQFIENYEGTYHIIPQVDIEQILHTKNKVLNADIIIEQIPNSVISRNPTYKGRYEVVPTANIDQILRTKNTVLEENVVVEKIPYAQTSNEAGGYTVTIG